MQIISDLHIHSKYSRAVSQQMNLEEIARSAKLKGIQLVATGDWTHPLWFREIKENLKETAKGIYSLDNNEVQFILSTEISSIYSQGDRLRRIHSVVISPSLETCEKISKELTKRGCNLMADGRPIIGLSAKELLQLVLSIDKRIIFIPCHVWTPWFSLYGSKSGFDSIEECFGELSNNIYAIETGLSSDPLMNWQIKELRNRSIVSFSDAHSAPKLGREATVFVPTIQQFNNLTIKDFTYDDFADAIKQTANSRLKIGYTIEFFPEEGKYHWTGHRSCNIKYSADETKNKGVICPVCHKPLTVGVENRVLELSKKLLTEKDLLFVKNQAGLTFVYDKEKLRRPFVSLVPLLEVLTEINDGSPTKAKNEYDRLTSTFSTEFDILMKKPYQEIEKAGGERLKQAIEIIRERKVFVDPGYDGVFGKVKIFKNADEQIKKEESQQTLF